MSGINRDRIQNVIVTHGIKPVETVHGHARYPIEAVLTALIADLKATPNQFERKAHFAAELLRQKIDIETGALIPIAEAERTYGSAFQIMATFIDTLPDWLERNGAAPAAAARLERRLGIARADLAARLATFKTPPE